MPAKKQKYDVPSLRLGVEVLEYLSYRPQGCLLTELATATKSPLSSMFRIVAALEDLNLLRRQEDTKMIQLTDRLLTMGQRSITETNLAESALDILRELRDAVVDTVLLGVRSGTEIVVLDEVLGNRTFSFISKLGHRIGMGYSAPGRAILANMPEGETAILLKKLEWVQHTPRTIASAKALLPHLATIRKQGYAVDNEEHYEGVYCVAAPLFDRGGYPIAAIWTTGLMADVGRKNIPEIGQCIKAHAARITERLRSARTR